MLHLSPQDLDVAPSLAAAPHVDPPLATGLSLCSSSRRRTFTHLSPKTFTLIHVSPQHLHVDPSLAEGPSRCFNSPQDVHVSKFLEMFLNSVNIVTQMSTCFGLLANVAVTVPQNTSHVPSLSLVRVS